MFETSRRTRNENPRVGANFVSRLTFLYTREIFIKSKHKDLETDDIYKSINNCQSDVIGDILEKQWEESKHEKNKSLTKVLIRIFGWEYFFYGLLNFCIKTPLLAIIPYTTGTLISHFDSKSTTKQSAIICAAILILCGIINSIYTNYYNFAMQTLWLRTEISISALIYRKSLTLTENSLRKMTSGRIMTLIGKDALMLSSCSVLFLHDLWIGILEVIIVMGIMYYRIGVESLVGIGLFLSVIPIQLWIGVKIKALCLKTLAITDERVRIIQEILTSIRLIKFNCWELYFTKIVRTLRIQEMSKMRATYFLKAINLALSSMSYRISYFFCVFAYFILGSNISAEELFFLITCYKSLDSLLSNGIPYNIAMLAEGKSASERIQKFLTITEENLIENEEDCSKETETGTKHFSLEDDLPMEYKEEEDAIKKFKFVGKEEEHIESKTDFSKREASKIGVKEEGYPICSKETKTGSKHFNLEDDLPMDYKEEEDAITNFKFVGKEEEHIESKKDFSKREASKIGVKEEGYPICSKETKTGSKHFNLEDDLPTDYKEEEDAITNFKFVGKEEEHIESKKDFSKREVSMIGVKEEGYPICSKETKIESKHFNLEDYLPMDYKEEKDAITNFKFVGKEEEHIESKKDFSKREASKIGVKEEGYPICSKETKTESKHFNLEDDLLMDYKEEEDAITNFKFVGKEEEHIESKKDFSKREASKIGVKEEGYPICSKETKTGSKHFNLEDDLPTDYKEEEDAITNFKFVGKEEEHIESKKDFSKREVSMIGVKEEGYPICSKETKIESKHFNLEDYLPMDYKEEKDAITNFKFVGKEEEHIESKKDFSKREASKIGVKEEGYPICSKETKTESKHFNLEDDLLMDYKEEEDAITNFKFVGKEEEHIESKKDFSKREASTIGVKEEGYPICSKETKTGSKHFNLEDDLPMDYKEEEDAITNFKFVGKEEEHIESKKDFSKREASKIGVKEEGYPICSKETKTESKHFNLEDDLPMDYKEEEDAIKNFKFVGKEEHIESKKDFSKREVSKIGVKEEGYPISSKETKTESKHFNLEDDLPMDYKEEEDAITNFKFVGKEEEHIESKKDFSKREVSKIGVKERGYPIKIIKFESIEDIVETNEDFSKCEGNLEVKENGSVNSPETKTNSAFINMKNATVKIRERIILKNAYLKSTQPTLIAIIGDVAEGKSTLLKILARIIKPNNGIVFRRGRISYASQEPWLFPGTIRENILFGNPYEPTKYMKVLEICALLKDLETFPEKDLSLVLDKGLNLSKGQQARINLARAVYKEAEIYLLDDVLASLDGKVGRFIFENCIKRYLKEKLCVLVAQNLDFAKEADEVYVIKSPEIKKVDIYKDLQAGTNDFENKGTVISEESSKMPLDANTDKQCSNFEKGDGHAEIFRESKVSGKVDKRVYKMFLEFAGGWKVLSLLFFICFSAQLVGTIFDYYANEWVDIEAKIIDFTNSNMTMINNTTISLELNLQRNNVMSFYGAVLLLFTILIVIEFFSVFAIVVRATRNMHLYVFEKIMTASMVFFDSHYSGSIVSRFSRDMSQVDACGSMFLETVKSTLELTVITSLIIYLSPILCIPAVIFFFVLIYSAKRFLQASRSLRRMELMVRAPCIGFINATLEGLTTIKATKNEDILKKQFDRHQNLYSGVVFMIFTTKSAFGLWLNTIGNLFLAFVIFSFIIFHNEIENIAGNAGVAITQALGVSSLLQFCVTQWAEVENTMTTIERITEYAKAEQEGHLQKTNRTKEESSVEKPKKAKEGLSEKEIVSNETRVNYVPKESPKCLQKLPSNISKKESLKYSCIKPSHSIFKEEIPKCSNEPASNIREDECLNKLSLEENKVHPIIKDIPEISKKLPSKESIFNISPKDPKKYALYNTNAVLISDESLKTPKKLHSNFEGKIEFKNVTLKYPKSEQLILNSINFVIKPKQKIGIIGRTGAGKSSIISTLFHLYNFEGEIFIDDTDISKIDLNTLRSKISIIPQDPILFKGTIRSNLDPYDNFTDSELWRALEKVGLKKNIQNNFNYDFVKREKKEEDNCQSNLTSMKDRVIIIGKQKGQSPNNFDFEGNVVRKQEENCQSNLESREDRRVQIDLEKGRSLKNCCCFDFESNVLKNQEENCQSNLENTEDRRVQIDLEKGRSLKNCYCFDFESNALKKQKENCQSNLESTEDRRVKIDLEKGRSLKNCNCFDFESNALKKQKEKCQSNLESTEDRRVKIDLEKGRSLKNCYCFDFESNVLKKQEENCQSNLEGTKDRIVQIDLGKGRSLKNCCYFDFESNVLKKQEENCQSNLENTEDRKVQIDLEKERSLKNCYCEKKVAEEENNVLDSKSKENREMKMNTEEIELSEVTNFQKPDGEESEFFQNNEKKEREQSFENVKVRVRKNAGVSEDINLNSAELRMKENTLTISYKIGGFKDDTEIAIDNVSFVKHSIRGIEDDAEIAIDDCDGLFSFVDEGGLNLSVGQRQLLILARILLSKNKIIILDEATASVDRNSCNFIKNVVRDVFEDCTVIVIAHKIDTLLHTDQIFTIEDGRIAKCEDTKEFLKSVQL